MKTSLLQKVFFQKLGIHLTRAVLVAGLSLGVSTFAQTAWSRSTVGGSALTMTTVELSVDEAALLPEGLRAAPLYAPDALPFSGTFYSLQHTNYPPFPGNINNLPCWSLGDGAFLLQDVIFDYPAAQEQALAARSPLRSMGMMSLSGVPSPGDGGSGGGDGGDSYSSPWTIDTNGLWLEITNVSNGLAYLNLHNATNQVYAIWSTPTLPGGWQVETEVWPPPEQTNVMPFTVPTLSQSNLFVRAQDWTGVTENGNTTPNWWLWKYFGTTALTDTNLDSVGNTLLFDYQVGMDPNPISFSTVMTNLYVNSSSVPVKLLVAGGTPFYMAVLVNDYNQADAVWVPYSSNLVASLNSGDGNYTLQVGLRGHAADSSQTWKTIWLVLDTLPPVITITNPPNMAVSSTTLNLQGYANETLRSVTFDVGNANGVMTNQSGYLTGSYFDGNLSACTTNYFTCPNVSLTSGSDWVTVHVTDLAGNTADLSLALNCSVDTSQPGLNVLWPADGLSVSGSSFTVQAQVNNPAASVSATIVDASGNTNAVSGSVEGNGQAWVKNLPLGAGANTVTVTAGLSSGVTNTQTFTVIGNDVGLVIDPLTQFNQDRVTITGSVDDPVNDCVFVNGINAYYTDDFGDWEADAVPVSPSGTAAIKVEVYVGDPVLIGTQTQFVPQPVTVQVLNYQLKKHSEYNSMNFWSFVYIWYLTNNEYITVTNHGSSIDDKLDDTKVNWLAGAGGTLQSVGFDDKIPGPVNYQSSYGPNQSDFHAIGMPWESADVDVPSWSRQITWGSEWGSYQNQTSTRVQLLSPGGQANGLTNVYLVWMSAVDADNFPPDWDTSLLPLPPEAFQIGNQPLLNTGETNTSGDISSGAVWGITTVSAPAGQNVEVTPSFIVPPQTNWDYNFDMHACQIFAPAVDANRDGNITFDAADQTTADNPYRFWVNNDHDGYDGNIADYADLDPTTGSDTNNTSISCTRDLEDYTRLWINTQGITTELQNGTFLLALEWKEVTDDDPQIRIFQSVETNGGALYLTNISTAQLQTNAPYGNNVVSQNSSQNKVSSSAPFIFPPSFWSGISTNQPVAHLLFDAVSRGSGQLVVAIYKNDGVTKLAESQPLYMKLQDVKEMYERWTVGDSDGGAVATTASLASGYSYDSTIPAENNYILFVHGWNLAPWEKDAFAETAFKRLYWQGYKGKFGAFQWPTGYGISDTLDAVLHARNYDNSESNAWASATGLLNKLNDLDAVYSHDHVYLMAHSMGNVVAGEALKLASSQVVKTYIACQAAVSAHGYDPNTAVWTTSGSTPDIYANYWTNGASCYFNGSAGAGTYVNFYNVSDYALDKWTTDQYWKPDHGVSYPGYYYDTPSSSHPSGFYKIVGSTSDVDLYFPTNNYETLAYCVQSQSYALGTRANVAGAFTDSQVDLGGEPFNYNNAHKYHSAEFLSDNMSRAIFWNTLLKQIGF